MAETKSEPALYRLEFIIEANSKTEVIGIIADIFGSGVGDKIKPDEITRKSGLYFLEHSFSEDELTDDNYSKLAKDARVVINRDDLALSRSGELLKICLPVEIQLKRNLAYVFPRISKVMCSGKENPSDIEICKRIHERTFGETIDLLGEDLASRWRRDFIGNDGAILLVELLNGSTDFNDLKKKLKPYFETKTVWDVMGAILSNPVKLSFVSGALFSLRRLRNKAAHPKEPILKRDFRDAKKNVNHVMRYIGNIRKDTAAQLDAIMKTIVEAMKTYQDYLNIASKITMPNLSAFSQGLSKSAEALGKIAMPKIDIPSMPPIPTSIFDNLLGGPMSGNKSEDEESDGDNSDNDVDSGKDESSKS